MRILSLFWHNVVPDSIDWEKIPYSYPTISNFKEQLEYIIGKYTPISIHDFIKITKENRLVRTYPKQPVLLGFDDGYKNVIDLALDILNEFRIPALLFVNGEVISNSNFIPWHVEYKYLIHKSRKRLIEYDNEKIDLSTGQGQRLMKLRFEKIYKSCNAHENRQTALNMLAEILDIPRPVASELSDHLRLATKKDLNKLNRDSLLSIASHGMTHNLLASLTRDEQIYELKESNYLLQDNCPSYYPVVSYPNGSFNSDTLLIAKGIYKCGFAVLQGSSYRNLYAYPRIGLGQHTQKELIKITNDIRLRYYRPVRGFLQKAILKVIYNVS